VVLTFLREVENLKFQCLAIVKDDQSASSIDHHHQIFLYIGTKNIPTVTNVRLVYTHFCIDSSKEITTSSTLLVLFIISVISFNQ